MDYRLDVETVTLRTALLEFLRARMPDPGAEPNADHRRRAWRELVASEWLEHYAAAVGDGSTPADHVGALHVVEAFGAAPVTGPVDVVAGYLLPLAERIGWTAPRERLRSGAVVTAVVPVLDLRSRGPRLAATRTRDRVTVTGVLPRVSCAAEADALVVALDLEGRPALGIVDLRGRGVTVGAPSGVDLRRPVAEVDLDAADMDPAEVSGTAELLEQEDLAVLGHSLGSVVSSDFLYDLEGGAPLGPAATRALGDTPLERGETFGWFYTLGSPLALWAQRHPDFGKPLTVPHPGFADRHPRQRGEWVNVYDPDDVIASPLRPLSDAWADAVREDRRVGVGPWWLGWTPLAHPYYWNDRRVVTPIASQLAQAWHRL